ncbi:hypothetical protein CM15mP35_03320 [bacterium]|nr:MAG: hypothetical protein CM15mP35_03320 [bacterium]
MHFKDIKQEVLDTVYKDKLDFDTAVSKGVFTHWEQVWSILKKFIKT